MFGESAGNAVYGVANRTQESDGHWRDSRPRLDTPAIAPDTVGPFPRSASMRRAWVRIAAAVAVWLLASALRGQIASPTANVYGTVRDDQDQPVSGATVTLTGPAGARSMASGRGGSFHFLGVPPGSYALSLERPGFEAARRDFEVGPGRNAVLAITLAVAGAHEAVTVGGGAAVFDRRQTETGATYDSPELRTIPTTRDPWGILRQVPGVLISAINVGNAKSTSQPAFVGKGSHDDQNVYDVDGVTVSQGGTSALLYDFDSLDSVSVTTGGSDPAIATPGVTLNLVTKRGTNTILGSGRGLYTDGTQWDYGVEAGGPIVSDRLWLWGAFARNAFLGQTFVLPDGETSRSQETQTYGNAKLNADLFTGNDLTLAYVNFQRTADGRGAGPMRSQPTTQNQTFPAQSYRVEDSQVFTPSLFGSAYFSYLSGARNSVPQGGLDEQADFIDDVWQNSFSVQRQSFPQHQAGAALSSFFDTGSLRHELKLGFGYRLAEFDSSSSWPGDLLVGDNTIGQASVTRPLNAKSQMRYYDTYVADTIAIDRLTVSLGARFDYQQSRSLASTVPANPVFPDLLPAANFSGDAGYPITWRDVQPRIGATYALGQDGATLLRASYARFANQLNANEISTVSAFPGIATLDYGWNDANGDGRVQPSEVDLAGGLLGFQNVDPKNPASSMAVNAIARDLTAPTTDEFIVGVEHSFSPDLAASLAYTYRRARDLEFAPAPVIGTTRADYQYAGNASGTAVDPSTGFVLAFSEPYYLLPSCPAPCSGTILENRPDYSETYSGLELQVLKKMSQGWMLRVGFAWNDWQQHVGAGAIVDPNNLVGGTNRSGPAVENDSANSIWINSTWQFNVSGAVQAPFGFLVAGNFYGRQGFPLLYDVAVTTYDLNPLSSPVLQIGPVGAYRLPDVFLLDLHVERPIAIGPAITVTPMIDCFNAANSHTVLTRDGNVGTYDVTMVPVLTPNPKFNAPGELLSDRLFRFGVRVTF
jgi:Carboxypeptidase regulatory-like domain